MVELFTSKITKITSRDSSYDENAPRRLLHCNCHPIGAQPGEVAAPTPPPHRHLVPVVQALCVISLRLLRPEHGSHAVKRFQNKA